MTYQVRGSGDLIELFFEGLLRLIIKPLAKIAGNNESGEFDAIELFVSIVMLSLLIYGAYKVIVVIRRKNRKE